MDRLPRLIVFIVFCLCITKITCQSVLFPHGYFDMNKLTAYDAFYLNMLAISTLENGGITEKELDDLAESRKLPVPSGSLQGMIENATNKTTLTDDDSDEFEPIPVKPSPQGTRPRIPFKRVRREEDDDDFNPFEDIVTRAPSTVPPQRQRLLNRNQILGVSGARPHQRGGGAREESEMPKEGWSHPRRRKPYIDIDWSKPQIVELPLPPDA